MGFQKAISSTCAVSTLYIRVETSKYTRRCLGNSVALIIVSLLQLPRQCLGNLLHLVHRFLLPSAGPITYLFWG